ncbi:MAG: peptide ABC transporter substrate-binding protein [Pseudomonadales bacterium]|jgi:oligopeptide transport system substrate-binding protein
MLRLRTDIPFSTAHVLVLVLATFVFGVSMAIAPSAHAAGVNLEDDSITISLYVEPPNLDSTLSEDTTSGFILGLTNEGLVVIGKRGEIYPGVAESWEIGANQAIFKLRKDARWANGAPITAHDFVFSWRRLVDPRTAAAGSTFFAYVLENAGEILAGKLPPASLGVEAIDDLTLLVRLSQPVPYLLTILSGTAYFPLNQKFVEAQAGRFGAEAENMLSNGPFVLEDWMHNSSIKLSKSNSYWNAKDIRLSSIDVGYITSDVRSLLNVYKSKELATLQLNEEILSDAADSNFRIQKAPTNCLAWLWMNLRPGRVTSNLKIRQAIRLAFDRDRYVNTIVGLPGTRKIDTVFTKRIKGVNASFQKEYPATALDFDIKRARMLIEEAKAEMGVDEIPSLVILANETRQIEAEFIQAQLGSALGLDIKVDKQTFKQSLDKMSKGEFDIARAGFCGGALRDPVFFAGIFISEGTYNDAGYANPRYDELMAITNSSANPKIRMDAFGKMQEILYNDIPIIPTHESSYVYLQDSRVKGLMRYPVVDFSKGFLTP